VLLNAEKSRRYVLLKGPYFPKSLLTAARKTITFFSSAIENPEVATGLSEPSTATFIPFVAYPNWLIRMHEIFCDCATKKKLQNKKDNTAEIFNMIVSLTFKVNVWA